MRFLFTSANEPAGIYLASTKCVYYEDPERGIPRMEQVKMLIADDTADCRKLLTVMLPTLIKGVQIVEAEDGIEAISILNTTTDFDLIISDYSMPNATGANIFSYLKSRNLQIPFILFTVFTECDPMEFASPFFVGMAPKHDLRMLQTLIRKSGVLSVETEISGARLIPTFS